MKVMIGRVSFFWCARQFASVKHEHSHGDSLCDSRLLSFASKKGFPCGRVSDLRFNSLKSSLDSSRQYTCKKMHPHQLFLGRVRSATGVRDGTTNMTKGSKGSGHSSFLFCFRSSLRAFVFFLSITFWNCGVLGCYCSCVIPSMNFLNPCLKRDRGLCHRL